VEELEGERSLKAVLFSDMRGYSALMSTDEERALRLLAEHDRIITPIVALHHGRLIKKIGDALMVSFGSGGDAVDCAVDIQESLARYNESRDHDDQIVIRIGVHVGEIIEREGDLFGHGVNLAARLEPLAPPGGIAVSETVVSLLKARPKFTFRSVGQHRVKNLEEPLSVFHVAAVGAEEAHATTGSAGTTAGSSIPGLQGDLSAEEARQAVRPVAIGLIAVGVVNWVAITVCAGLFPLFGVDDPIVFAVLAVVSMPLSFVVMFGGHRMMHLRSRRLALTACVAVLFASPGNVIGFPLGVWGLSLLTRPDLKAAFARVE